MQGRYRAFLFDMDGTIINSIAAAERVWRAWAVRHGLDVASFVPTIHGARAVDTIARVALPGLDPETEAMAITAAEIIDVAGIVEIDGARAFLQALPPAQWAIVTSAPRELALARLAAAGMPVPAVLVSADDVRAGKPEPEGYLLAAEKLKVDIGQCLVFEDATVGIAAGEAAGAALMVVTATHVHPVETRHASIAGYAWLVATAQDGYISLQQRA
ncbi:MAG: HAD-IA family hydrolase [Pseudomonadota bacterium]